MATSVLSWLRVTLFAFLALAAICQVCSGAEIWDYEMKDYKDHPCNRPCLDNDPPRICRYEFLVESYYVLSRACRDCPFNQSHCFLPHCVPSDGVRRAIKTVNRMMPGPSIQVCLGDTVEVTVDNALDSAEGTSIHWHGILQKGSQVMDGVSMVTQCPITYHSKFTYQFKAADRGTHFWHGHSGVQRADGLYGSLIVREPPAKEIHNKQYDYDLPEHVITVTDWTFDTMTDRLPRYVHYDYENKARLMLINGMGKYQGYVDARNRTVYTPYATFTVDANKKYRFRLINAGIMNCALQFSIDDHNVSIIATDGNPVRPYSVKSFSIYSGERFDFVLHANKIRRNYWIRVRGLGNCGVFKATQTAILNYRGGLRVPMSTNTTWEAAASTGINFNSAIGNSTDENEVTELVSAEPDTNSLSGNPDKKFFLALDFVQVENLRAHNSQFYPFDTAKIQFFSPQINWISTQLPPSPPLTQLQDLPANLFCNAETVQKQCKKEWCACVHLIKVALGDLVEIIIVDEGTLSHAYHPMHLHGHKFKVVGMGRLSNVTTLEKVKEMDSKGQLPRSHVKGPLKDTVIVPDGGYTIIRFKADNPGFWLFHCHVEQHAETGMALVIQVGNKADMPPRPANFPTCGHWKMAD